MQDQTYSFYEHFEMTIFCCEKSVVVIESLELWQFDAMDNTTAMYTIVAMNISVAMRFPWILPRFHKSLVHTAVHMHYASHLEIQCLICIKDTVLIMQGHVDFYAPGILKKFGLGLLLMCYFFG